LECRHSTVVPLPASRQYGAGPDGFDASVTTHHPFTPRVGATEPARLPALDGLQAAGQVDLVHHMRA